MFDVTIIHSYFLLSILMKAIREIRILKALKHQNVIELREIVSYHEEDNASEEDKSYYDSKSFKLSDIFMVFEFASFDLSGILKSRNLVSISLLFLHLYIFF